jgi:hypothetical protein
LQAPAVYRAQYNDAALWLSYNLEKKLSAKTSLMINPELRFNENMTELGNAFIDVGLGYKLTKQFRVSASYRLSQLKRLDNTYGTRHRYYADVTYKTKFGKVGFSYRLRMQQQYYQYNRSDNGHNSNNAIRNKIQFKYNLEKRYTPFLSAELWYQKTYKYSNFNRLRISGGIDYEINKLSGVTATYIYQTRFNIEDPRTDYIISLSYNYSF